MKTKHKSSHKPRALTGLTPPRPTPGAAEGDLDTIEDDLRMKERKEPREPKSVLPYGMQKTREVKARDVEKDEESDTYSEMGSGRLDTDEVADIHNPAGVQGGRGPLNQEGEGNRQNDEAAELEEVEPNLDPYPSPR